MAATVPAGRHWLDGATQPATIARRAAFAGWQSREGEVGEAVEQGGQGDPDPL